MRCNILGREESSPGKDSSAKFNMDLYNDASEEEKKRQQRLAAMEVYIPLEEEMLKILAYEVLEEVNSEVQEASFTMFTVDDNWNVENVENAALPADDPQLEEDPQEEIQVADDQIINPPTLEEVHDDEEIHRTYVMDRRNRNTVRKTESVSVKKLLFMF